MKLSEFKEKVIGVHGEKVWEKLEKSNDYKIYNLSTNKQVEEISDNGFNVLFVEKPTDELIRMAIETIGNTYELSCLLCLIENDSAKKIRLADLKEMTLEEIKDLLKE